MRILTAIFLLTLACSIPATTMLHAAARADAAEDFIQGTWRAEGTDPSGKHSWYLEWTLDHGKFKETGYPPLEQEGSYRILKTEGNKLTLEFFDQKGTFGTENSRLEMVLNKSKGTLTFNRMVFKRVKQ